MKLPALLAVLIAMALAARPARAAEESPAGALRAYVGTYTGPKAKGIYVFRFDSESGKPGPVELAAEVRSPSFLAIHPHRRFLYAVNESGGSGKRGGGAVSAFAIDEGSGKLSLLDEESSGGDGPCHIVVDSAGKNVLIANYGGGSVAALPISGDGKLGPATAFIQHRGSSVDPGRQKGPHAHAIVLDAKNRFALTADLGLDKVLVYRFDPAKGSLEAAGDAALKPGSGPRHLAFHPDGRRIYVINELSSTLTAFRYDAERGALQDIGTASTLPEGHSGRNSTAEIVVHPSGRFVYGSNRGHDSIALFALDAQSGMPRFVECRPTGGKTPRNFTVDASGRWLLAANQDSDTITVFRIDPATGKLTREGEALEAPAPVCIELIAAK